MMGLSSSACQSLRREVRRAWTDLRQARELLSNLVYDHQAAFLSD